LKKGKVEVGSGGSMVGFQQRATRVRGGSTKNKKSTNKKGGGRGGKDGGGAATLFTTSPKEKVWGPKQSPTFEGSMRKKNRIQRAYVGEWGERPVPGKNIGNNREEKKGGDIK